MKTENGIGENGALSLLEALKNNTTLKKLNLRGEFFLISGRKSFFFKHLFCVHQIIFQRESALQRFKQHKHHTQDFKWNLSVLCNSHFFLAFCSNFPIFQVIIHSSWKEDQTQTEDCFHVKFPMNLPTNLFLS